MYSKSVMCYKIKLDNKVDKQSLFEWSSAESNAVTIKQVILTISI